MGKLNRRKFIGVVIGGTGAAATGTFFWRGRTAKSEIRDGGFIIDSAIKCPTDRVSLGKSGIKVSMVRNRHR